MMKLQVTSMRGSCRAVYGITLDAYLQSLEAEDGQAS